MIEVWKKVNCFEGLYEISNIGRLRSKEANPFTRDKGVGEGWKNIKGTKTKDGFIKVSLCLGGGVAFSLIHLLVAEHFVDNVNKLPQVKFKDENKLNCKFDNLEWVSFSENKKRGIENKHNKSVIQFDLNGNYINQFISIKHAEMETKIKAKNISKNALGKTKSAGGYSFIKNEDLIKAKCIEFALFLDVSSNRKNLETLYEMFEDENI